MMSPTLLLCVVFAAAITTTNAGFCNRIICGSVRRRVCTYKTWRGCCTYKTIFVSVYRRQRYCCSGFRGRNCDQPICNPTCKNGGTCIAPGRCRCPAGREGPDCSGVATCSHLDPCYPGVCSRECQCQSRFGGAHCQQIMDPPVVWKTSSRLASLKVSNDSALNGMLMYEVITDSSNPSSSAMDFIWSNQRGFNFLEISCAAQFDPSDLPPTPNYVRDYSLGVNSVFATVTHTKISPKDGTTYNTTRAYTCNATSDVLTFWNCSIREYRFNELISNGDTLHVDLTFKSGGDVTLINPDTGRQVGRPQDYFLSQSTNRNLLFRFDLMTPRHCTERGRCDILPLSVQGEITQDLVNITWGGWNDDLSGMYRYAWEVFRLKRYTTSGELREPEPLKPLVIMEWLADDGVPNITYNPPESGMYSVILEASDRANNSRYSRRFFLYDNSSRISTSDTDGFYVSSASEKTGYTWQVTSPNSTNDVVVTWKNHFVNELHETEGFLNSILKYPPQFTEVNLEAGGQGKFTIKTIEFDDTEGRRTRNKIPNVRGIVTFETAFARDVPPSQEPNEEDFEDMKLPRQTLFIPGRQQTDGQNLTVWVRVTDIMNHNKTERVTVSFDGSAPRIFPLQLQQNVQSGSYPFSSLINLNALDEHSGISQISWNLSRDDTGEILKEDKLNLDTYARQKSECSSQDSDCQCTRADVCIATNFRLDLNHCWLKVGKNSLGRTSVTLNVTAYNAALLSNSESLQLNDLRSFRGIGEYYAPQNVRVIREGFNTVRITWTNPQTCYNITELWVNYTGEGTKQKIHRNSSFYDLTGLSPETNYSAHLIAGYDGEMSDAAVFVFRTGPAPAGLSAGGKAGVAIGVILFIILILAGVFLLYHFGFIALGSRKRKEAAAVGFNPVTRKSRRTPMGTVDDDIYVDGGLEFEIPIGVQFSSEKLVLQDVITEGKFARIYKASLKRPENETETVVAKMVRDDNEEDRKLMKGKILFYVNEVGDHPNVLKMVAAVVDNDAWGPVMVMEHCEMGTLRSWLVKHKDKLNDDVIEQMYQFAYGIVKGMTYLANLGIIHRRLAARNVLLTFLLDVKITGFGPAFPSDGETGENAENSRRERVPIRWVAPECFKSTKDATERSDVWSFGVVLWEIFSLGDNPYPTLKTHEIPTKVKSGHRMTRPEYCDEFNYATMTSCWAAKESDRPKFEELLASYNKLMTGGGSDADYSNYSNYKGY